MSTIALSTGPEVDAVFAGYPDIVKDKMLELRKLVIETADEIEGLSHLEETLKWGEPSYLAKNGSTLRMDWKAKNPNQYALYFNCNSSLVETFKMIYGDLFKYEKNSTTFLFLLSFFIANVLSIKQ